MYVLHMFVAHSSIDPQSADSGQEQQQLPVF
jgi:hypothetical protein